MTLSWRRGKNNVHVALYYIGGSICGPPIFFKDFQGGFLTGNG